MARRLVEWGHDVQLVTAWREPTERKGWFQTEEAGINVHWLPVAYSNRMGFTDRVSAFIRFAIGAMQYASRLSGDVVFATSTPLTIVLPGLYAARKIKVPLVFEVRDLWPAVPIALGVVTNPILKFLSNQLELMAYRNSRRIVVLAPGMKDAVVAKGGIPERTIDVIPNGADLALFSAINIDEKKLRQQHGIPDNRRIILYTGALGWVNGVDYIIRLSEELDKLGADDRYFFVVIGDGCEHDNLKRIAQQNKVLGRMLLMLGSKPKYEVIEWYRICTASIMTYSGPEIVYRDSVSNKFFDSLAAGKPVLTNFSGYSTKIAEEVSAGKILPPDPIDAAPIFLESLDDDNWVKSAGAAARKLGEERFSRDKLARDLEQTLLAAVE